MLQKGKQLSSMHKDISELTQTLARLREVTLFFKFREGSHPFPSRFINRTACFPRKVPYFRKFRVLP